MTKYVEPDVGQIRGPGEPQSEKLCEECLYFNRCVASDEPCGICYESKDKFNWTEKNGDSEPGEMALPNERVCKACPR